ncbi:hypothetical protein [uncultured Psychroserpens sp.]|uniref:hypothetical protein n=1 Tax=uncultured Psychroserpens sp. TaxID=255436 RepID=UPI00261A47DB|nr:hypothetical protein [uncultured Psychroserpens sp.]
MKTTKTYSEAIRLKYISDKKSDKLRGEIYRLTPANIRKLFLNLINNELSEADKIIMKNNFDARNYDSIRKEINSYDIDKFKPICKFLKKENESMSSHELLELTAILVDFSPRPYSHYRNEDINLSSKNIQKKEPNETIEDLEEKQENKSDNAIIFLPDDTSNRKTSKKEENEKGNSKDGSVIINNYQRIIIYIKNNTIKLILSTLLIASIFVIISINQKRWMVWQNDHYIEVKFDIEKYDLNQLKLYKKERILNFKKITPDCSTDFFKSDGTENLWYGKNIDGKLEYFTDLGLHPETGTTLKKITNHMIKKYICDTY